MRKFTHRHAERWQRELTSAIRDLGARADRETLLAYLAWPASRLRDYLHALEADGTVASSTVYRVPTPREREQAAVASVTQYR